MSALPRPNNSDFTARVTLARSLNSQDVARQVLGDGKPSGARVAYLSPFHAERTPSFMVYPDNRGFFDFGNGGQHYDNIAFIEARYNLDFAGAVDFLTGAATVLPLRIVQPTAQPTEQADKPDRQWQARAAQVVKDGVTCLWRNIRAVCYLRNRGIKSDTIRAFHLGYDPKRGIIIPWYQDGELLSVRYRRHMGNLAEALGVRPVEGGKYICLLGSKPSAALFNGDAIRANLPVVIVEGEFDAMLGQQIAGDLAVFVTRGSASAGKNLPTAIKAKLNTAARRLIVLDSDGAGSNGTKSLAEQLPDATCHQLPSGKDLTEFVMAGGKLRSWLTDILTAVYLRDVSDGIRQAALNCKLDPALLIYELAGWAKLDSFTKPEIVAVGEKFGLDGRNLQRGVDQGVGVFLTKSTPKVSLVEDDFVRKPSLCGRTPDRYQVESIDRIVSRLSDLLPTFLIRKHFTLKGKRDEVVIPAPTLQLLSRPEIVSVEQVINEMMRAFEFQKGDAAKKDKIERQYNFYRNDLEALRSALNDGHSTPIRWVADVSYEAMFFRAIQVADPTECHRSRRELAQIVGKRPGSVGRILKQAGIESTKREPEYVPLASPDKVTIAARTAAKGRGHIMRLVAKHNGRWADDVPFNHSEDTQRWADEQTAQGREIGVMLERTNEQHIVSEPVPTVRPDRTVAPVPTVKANVIELTSDVTAPVKAKAQPTKAAAVSDTWLRDYLLRGYCINNGIEFEDLPVDRLTITDAVNLLLDRVPCE